MPRVHHVKKARKDQPRCDVKAGESYYWWKNRPPGRAAGIMRCSKSLPRRSQVLMGFASELASIEEMIEDDTRVAPDNIDDAIAIRDTWVEQIRSLAYDQGDKLNNMPEGLQRGDTGMLLEERRDCLDAWADALEGVEPNDPEEEGDDEPGDALVRAIEEFFTELDCIGYDC